MKWLSTISICIISNFCLSQKNIEALPIEQPIVLNAEFNESIWENAIWTSDFTQLKPRPGNKPTKRTEVAILYDQEALYFGIKCFDNPDSVSKVLSVRDDFNPNLDLFAIFIDTYNDRQNGFFFGITSRGVQLDAKIFNGDFNDLLNLVWRSK